MAVKSVLNPEVIVGKNPGNIGAAKNFISGGSLLGSSIVSSAANKIVGFQRSAAVRPVVPDINSILNTISSNIINNVSNSIQTVTNNLSRGTAETIQNVKNEIIQNINKSIITNKSELINYVNQINVVNKKEFIEQVSQIIDQTNTINKNVTETKEELVQYVDNIFNQQDIINLFNTTQNNVSNNIQRIEGRLNTIQVEKINDQIIQDKTRAATEKKIEEIINQTVVNDQQIVNAKQELIQYVDNVFKTQDITNIVNNIQNNTFSKIEKVENEINQIKEIQASQQVTSQSIVPDSRNTVLNVEKTIQNIIQSTRDTIDNIQRQTADSIRNTVDNLAKNYQQRVKEVDDAKPVGILDRFLKAYNTAIGFIQFFNNRKNMDRLRTSLSNLKTSFTETFEVAKLVRQVIIKIVKQLSNLPKVSPSGGGGINLDVDVPGSPLRRAAPQATRRMGMGKMLGFGALGAGAATGGGMVINALADSGSVQPMMQESFIPQGTVDMFSTIVERFTSAVDSLIKQAQSPSRKSSGTKSGSAQPSAPATPGTDSGGNAKGAPPITTTGAKGVLDLIASVEQGPEGYDSFNVSKGRTPGKATEQTIGWLAKNARGAIGRYQHMPEFLVERAKAAGFNENTKFTPQVQDAITIHMLRTGHGLDRFLSGQMTAEEFGSKLAPTWRGLPQGERNARRMGGSADLTYQDRYASRNKAHKTWSTVVSELRSIQRGPNVPIKDKPTTQAAQTSTRTPTVVPSPQQQIQTSRVQSVSQPPPQQKSQVNVIPIDLSSNVPQQTGGGAITSPPPQQISGPTVPFLSSGNPENFLVLYSKMVYNIVDG